MTPLMWCSVVAVLGVCVAALGLIVANCWYDETESGGWDE